MIHFTIIVIINQKPLAEVKLTNKQEQNVCWSSRPHREKFHPKSMAGERVKKNSKKKIHKRRSTGEKYLPKNAAEGPTHQEWSQVDDKRRTKGNWKDTANKVTQYFIQTYIE